MLIEKNPDGHTFGLKVLKRLESLTLLGVVLFIFSISFPPLDLMAQINLPIHMAQHVLILLSGVMIAYPFYLKEKAKGVIPRKDYAVSSIIVVAVLVVFWHLPAAWDAAVLNPLVHGIEHLSFLAVGLIIGWFFPVLEDNYKFMLVFLAASAHMVYGIYLYIMNTPVYPLYPVSQQATLGVLLLFPSPLYFIVSILYSLDKETKRLERLELAPTLEYVAPEKRTKNRSSIGKIVVPVTTILLVVIFVGYVIVIG